MQSVDHVRHMVMHLVVPKQMTVEAGHVLTIKSRPTLKKGLSYSHILVHIEPVHRWV